MVVQTSVNALPEKGAPGMVADGWAGTDIMSAAAGEPMNPGVLVTLDSGKVELPDAAADFDPDAVAGIVCQEHKGFDSKDNLFSAGDSVPVMKKGRVWVVTEDTLTVGAHPYVRHAADGGNTTLGAFRSATATGATTQVSYIRVVEVASASLAKVEILLPAADGE